MFYLNIPLLLAGADVAAILAYMFGFAPATAQAAALVVKIALVAVAGDISQSILARRFVPFMTIALACIVSLIFANDLEVWPLLQSAGFTAHLALSLLILRAKSVRRYAKFVSFFIAASALVYVLAVAAGQVPDKWGRLLYFHGAHPNVGAEIAAIGVIAAAIAFRMRMFLLVAAAPVLSAFLMKGRATIIAVSLVFALKALFVLLETARSQRRRSQLLFAFPLALLAGGLLLPLILDAMMITDANRGAASGFVGRAERWELGMAVFRENPLTGVGIGSFVALDRDSPHNFFIYGLAEMGLLFGLVMGTLIFLFAKGVAINRWQALYVAPVTVLMLFNDRFLNLNPYPFVVLVLLFGISLQPYAGRQLVLPSKGWRVLRRLPSANPQGASTI